MTFVCQYCRECCSIMGEIISIEEQIPPCEFRIRYNHDGGRVVSVDPDKRALVGDQQQAGKNSLARPSLRQRAPCGCVCTCTPAGLNSAGTTSVAVSPFSWVREGDHSHNF